MDKKPFGKTPPTKSYYILGKSARFISLKLIPLIDKTKIQPIHLSIVSFASALLSSLFFSFGNAVTNKFALVFFFTFFIADHMDGDLARFRGQASLTGEVLDHVIGKLSLILIYCGIFCGLSRLHNPVFVWSMAFMIMAGFFGFQSLTTKRAFMVLKNDIRDHQFDKTKQFTGNDGLLRILFKELTSGYLMTFYLIILGSLFDQMIWAIVFSVIYVWFYYIFQIFTSLKYFHHIDHPNQ